MKNVNSTRLALLTGIAALIAPLLTLGAEESYELLEPEHAFRFSASLIAPATVEVRYSIAQGYYMYRDQFRVEVMPGTVLIGATQMPKGIVKDDEFFGRVETYRGELSFRLELLAPAPSQGLDLTVTSQGCADVGVCFVPLTQRARLKLQKLPLSYIGKPQT